MYRASCDISDHRVVIVMVRRRPPFLMPGRGPRVAMMSAILCCTATVLPGHERRAPSHLVRDRAVCLMRRVSPASAMQETQGVGPSDARLPSAAARAMRRLRGGGRRADKEGGEQGVGVPGEIRRGVGLAESAVRGRTRAGRQAMSNHTGSTAARKGREWTMWREEEDRRLRQVSIGARPRVYLHECDGGLGMARAVGRGPCVPSSLSLALSAWLYRRLWLPTSMACSFACLQRIYGMLIRMPRAYLSHAHEHGSSVPIPVSTPLLPCPDRLPHPSICVPHTPPHVCVR